MENVQLEPIAYGRWAARRGGWAVHGDTEEEAVKALADAEEERRTIMTQLPWWERVRGIITIGKEVSGSANIEHE